MPKTTASMNDPGVIIAGAGGHARVVADALLTCGRRVIGFTDADASLHGKEVLGLPILGGDEILGRYGPSEVELANGLGSVSDTRARAALFERMHARGYRFTGVRHPAAWVSQRAMLAGNVQVMAGAIVQVGAQLEENVLVNTAASIDHDCRIGAHSHIAPGATLCGAVEVGRGTHIGTGARILQGVRIGRACLVPAGAVVRRSVADGEKVGP
jgi:UDP-perosamine 4-acetyltransferase